MSEIGDRIREFIARKRMRTVEELARRSGIHPVQLSKYVNGVTKSPNIEALRQLQAVGLSIDWLISGLGPMEWSPPEPPVEIATKQKAEKRPEVYLAEVMIQSLQSIIDKQNDQEGASS